MKFVWVFLSVILGIIALLALVRLIERAVTGTLTGQAAVQLLIAIVCGLFAFKAFSKVRVRSS